MLALKIEDIHNQDVSAATRFPCLICCGVTTVVLADISAFLPACAVHNHALAALHADNDAKQHKTDAHWENVRIINPPRCIVKILCLTS